MQTPVLHPLSRLSSEEQEVVVIYHKMVEISAKLGLMNMAQLVSLRDWIANQSAFFSNAPIDRDALTLFVKMTELYLEDCDS